MNADLRSRHRTEYCPYERGAGEVWTDHDLLIEVLRKPDILELHFAFFCHLLPSPF